VVTRSLDTPEAAPVREGPSCTHAGDARCRLDHSKCIPVLDSDEVLVPKFVRQGLTIAKIERVMVAY